MGDPGGSAPLPTLLISCIKPQDVEAVTFMTLFFLLFSSPLSPRVGEGGALNMAGKFNFLLRFVKGVKHERG